VPLCPHLFRFVFGRWESIISIHKKRSREFGCFDVDPREDEEFVPEYVTSVTLPVESSRRNADIHINGVLGDGLNQMERVEAARRESVAINMTSGKVSNRKMNWRSMESMLTPSLSKVSRSLL